MAGVTTTDTSTRPGPEPTPTPAEALAALLAVLDLRAAPELGPDTFVADSQPQPWGRVYGGQVLGQAVVAAQRTVALDRPVHSMHAYFLRPGDPAEPITLAVERLRDGQSFSARRTHALQFGRPILSMIASFQEPAEGLSRQLPMPDGIPEPESLPTLGERYRHLTGEAARRWLRQRPLDLRHVEESSFVVAAAPDLGLAGTRQCVWMRTAVPVPNGPDGPDGPVTAALHAAILAYASDYSMLEPVLRAQGRSFAQPGLKVASLDHALWWHRPARADEWLLFVLESPSAQSARGLGTARVYTRSGELVASVAQEGMVRAPRHDHDSGPGANPDSAQEPS